mmetsp:Transcript_101309/g.253998  ORF Transcript_101309/g.253998 Transcript_101309/m.253998 type:complete len:294 (+) Transcript_101309:872-1753(+)
MVARDFLPVHDPMVLVVVKIANAVHEVQIQPDIDVCVFVDLEILRVLHVVVVVPTGVEVCAPVDKILATVAAVKRDSEDVIVRVALAVTLIEILHVHAPDVAAVATAAASIRFPCLEQVKVEPGRVCGVARLTQKLLGIHTRGHRKTITAIFEHGTFGARGTASWSCDGLCLNHEDSLPIAVVHSEAERLPWSPRPRSEALPATIAEPLQAIIPKGVMPILIFVIGSAGHDRHRCPGGPSEGQALAGLRVPVPHDAEWGPWWAHADLRIDVSRSWAEEECDGDHRRAWRDHLG